MIYSKKLLSFGEIIWDVYPDGRQIGGAPLNFAAHVASFGVQTWLLSGVGRDALGEEALARLEELGVNAGMVQKNDRPTGRCEVTLQAKDKPVYRVLSDAAFDRVSLSEEELDAVDAEGFDVLYFGTLAQRGQTSRSSLAALLDACRFPDRFCDLNLREGGYDADAVSLCLRNATILKLSLEEEPLLRALGFYECYSDSPVAIAKAISARYGNLRHILITMGENGSIEFEKESGICHRQDAVEAEVVSTVGAGDAFSAAWLAGYLDDLPPAIRLRRAAELSAFVVAHREAVPRKGTPRS